MDPYCSTRMEAFRLRAESVRLKSVKVRKVCQEFLSDLRKSCTGRGARTRTAEPPTDSSLSISTRLRCALLVRLGGAEVAAEVRPVNEQSGEEQKEEGKLRSLYLLIESQPALHLGTNKQANCWLVACLPPFSLSISLTWPQTGGIRGAQTYG